MKKLLREENIIEKRAVVCFFIITALLMSCVMRVAVISQSDYGEAAAKQSGYRISVCGIRGTIYDCNMLPVTNQKSRIMAAVSPTPEAIVAISAELEGAEKERVLGELKNGKPAVCEVKKEINAGGVICTTVYENTSSDMPAEHIIGYVNGENHGVSGLQAAYDELLYSGSCVEAVFSSNGRGKLLYGVDPYFENDLAEVNSGVVTTLDINIQNAVCNAADKIERGAVVVADSYTNEIKAMVSKPGFDATDVSKYLNSADSPLLNRALASYSVGSAFKPCVAAAAIENNLGNFTFECTGKTHIIDRDFRCHKRDGHGMMNLRTALAQSCNCFFYNFAIKLGAEPIYKTARNLSFDGNIKIADNIETSSGILPELQDISENAALLANLSIGQGKLMLSPVAMLNLYSAIASDGSYNLPCIVKGTLTDGSLKKYEGSKKTKVMSEKTAQLLRSYLASVVTEGTGTDAKPSSCTAAGKTATAQTGRFDENGREINNGWFCGFFPAEKPKYTVIVMTEGKSEISAASVFSAVADGINAYESGKKEG